jgi:hypothetical protein
MKKLLYLLIFSASLVTITSCTDEEVKPNTETGNAGGSPIKE